MLNRITQSQNPLQIGTHVFSHNGGESTINKDNVRDFVLEPGDILSSTDGTLAKVTNDGSEEIYADGNNLTADKSDDVKTIGAKTDGFKDIWKNLFDAANPQQQEALKRLLDTIKQYFLGANSTSDIDGGNSSNASNPANTADKINHVDPVDSERTQPASATPTQSNSTGNQQTTPENNGMGGSTAGGAAPTFQANQAGAVGDSTDTTSLKDHIDAILADGRDHGFPKRYESFKDRIKPAMDHLREKGIVTANDPYEAMQQAGNWLMANSGSDHVFSFGGGPNNEDDAARLTDKSHISREDINAVKFMFDSHHDAELSKEDAFLNVRKGIKVFDELATLI